MTISPQPPAPVYVATPPKSRFVYIVIALFFFGGFGLHNVYAKRYGVALAQFLLGLSCFGLVVTVFWAWIDVFTVTRDGDGVKFN